VITFLSRNTARGEGYAARNLFIVVLVEWVEGSYG